jgi:hypothetical protein
VIYYVETAVTFCAENQAKSGALPAPKNHFVTMRSCSILNSSLAIIPQHDTMAD